jgi:hypothetical protein
MTAHIHIHTSSSSHDRNNILYDTYTYTSLSETVGYTLSINSPIYSVNWFLTIDIHHTHILYAHNTYDHVWHIVIYSHFMLLCENRRQVLFFAIILPILIWCRNRLWHTVCLSCVYVCIYCIITQSTDIYIALLSHSQTYVYHIIAFQITVIVKYAFPKTISYAICSLLLLSASMDTLF